MMADLKALDGKGYCGQAWKHLLIAWGIVRIGRMYALGNMLKANILGAHVSYT